MAGTTKAKHVKMPLLILGMSVNVVILEDAKGKEVTALAPTDAVIAPDTEVKLAEFNDTYYVFQNQ